jgi:hypothetical protein
MGNPTTCVFHGIVKCSKSGILKLVDTCDHIHRFLSTREDQVCVPGFREQRVGPAILELLCHRWSNLPRVVLNEVVYYTRRITLYNKRICGSHGGEYEDGCLLGCSAMWSGRLHALMMEVARTSETLVNFYQTTRRYNPEDNHLPLQYCCCLRL